MKKYKEYYNEARQIVLKVDRKYIDEPKLMDAFLDGYFKGYDKACEKQKAELAYLKKIMTKENGE